MSWRRGEVWLDTHVLWPGAGGLVPVVAWNRGCFYERQVLGIASSVR